MLPESPPPPQAPFCLATSDALDLPRYSARDIAVLEKFLALGYVARVLVGRRAMCCKVRDSKYGKVVQREYKCLSTIALSKYAVLIRALRLLGLVVDEGRGGIGILEELIPSKYTLRQIDQLCGNIDNIRA